MNTPCILIADDSPSMRQLLSHTLGRAGYRTLEASDGQDALEQLEADAGPVDLALVDFNMPRLDGLGLVRRLRGRAPTRFIPILMVTTETRRERRDEARQAGATGWLTKPFREEDLLTTIQRLLPRPAAEAPHGR